MYNRRDLISMGGAALALSSCATVAPKIPVGQDLAAIDIHGHIFNARDIPVVGFLEQVVLRDSHEALPEQELTGELIRLLTFVLLEATLTPREELRQIRAGQDRALGFDSRPDAADIQVVARSLAKYRADAPGRDAAQGIDGADTPQARLLAEIYAPVRDGAGRGDAALGLDDPDMRAAASMYETDGETYRRRSPIVQNIRWAALLTRPRQEILQEYIRLYASQGQVRLLSPSVLDFALWFRFDEAVAPLADQVEVMSEIARRTSPLLVLNFLQYCPLRAAQSAAEQRRLLALLDHAVETRGFGGVKLYPPLGYKPFNNDPGARFGAKPGQRASGAQIDRALANLYDWSLRKGVPIKAHATHSNDAGQCTARFGSPAHWRPVLSRWKGLRLNLAHFGGFDESRGHTACDAGSTDWEAIIATTIDTAPGLYADLGFWTDAITGSSRDRSAVRRKLRALLSSYPSLQDRLMFGTDWSMVGRDPIHPDYIGQVRSVARRTGLNEDRFFRANALTYLGLLEDGPQRRRLERFFGKDRLRELVR